MTDLLSSELDLLFYALSDPTRRKILGMMGTQMRTITELAAPFKMSLAAISKHVKILERATLLVRKKQGRIHECTLNPDALKTAEACIQFYTQFWNEGLDLFAQSLEMKQAESPNMQNQGAKNRHTKTQQTWNPSTQDQKAKNRHALNQRTQNTGAKNQHTMTLQAQNQSAQDQRTRNHHSANTSASTSTHLNRKKTSLHSSPMSPSPSPKLKMSHKVKSKLKPNPNLKKTKQK